MLGMCKMRGPGIAEVHLEKEAESLSSAHKDEDWWIILILYPSIERTLQAMPESQSTKQEIETTLGISS